MKSILRFAGIAAGIVVLVLVAAVVMFVLFFDANDFRDEITQAVDDQTGRDLRIEGDLSLSVFPWLGFEAGATSLSNAPGFGDEPMASFDSAAVRVRVLPLLGRRLEVGQLRLEGLRLELVRREDGTSNFDDLLEAFAGEEAAPAEEETGPGFDTAIGGLRLVDARLRYADATTGEDYLLEELTVQTGALAGDQPFALEASTRFSAADPALAGTVTAKGTARLDMASGGVTLNDAVIGLVTRGDDVPVDELRLELRGATVALAGEDLSIDRPRLDLGGEGGGYTRLEVRSEAEALTVQAFDVVTLAAPALTLDVAGEGLPPAGVKGSLGAERVEASLAGETVGIAGLAAELLGMSLSGSLAGEQIYGDAVYRGEVRIAQFSPREVLERLGSPMTTSDASALASATFSSAYVLGTNDARFDGLQMTLDQTRIAGDLAVPDLTTGALRFDLRVDDIDLDRYMAPVEDGEDQDSAASLEDVVLPVEELRALDIDGRLAVGKMKLTGLRSTDIELAVRAQGGDVRIHPASAKLYGGSYEGNIGIDATGDAARVTLDEKLNTVQFGPLSLDLLGVDRLSGTLSGGVKLDGRGNTAAELLRSFDGNASFEFLDGAYEGIDVWNSVRRAKALFSGDAPPPAPEAPRTEFGRMVGVATVEDGVMRADTLELTLPFVRLGEGAGTVDLVSQQVDLRLTARVLDAPELDAGMESLVGSPVPVRITGTIAAPKPGVDVATALRERAQEEVEDKARELLQDKLGDRLGLNFGGAEPAPEGADAAAADAPAEEGAAEDESAEEEDPKDRLRKKLRDLFDGG